MAPRLERLSAREVLEALGSFGFEVVQMRGSHAKLRRLLPDGRRETLTVPLHKNLALGTIQAIYRQAARFIPESNLRTWFFRE